MIDENILKNAQYRKNLSIAYFNATNSAIEMVKLENELNPISILETTFDLEKPKGKKGKKKKKDIENIVIKDISFETRLDYWRAYFLEKHKDYYATIVANVGGNYKAEDSIIKLRKAKTLEELQGAWRMLSEDERHDENIITEVKKLKNDFLTIKKDV